MDTNSTATKESNSWRESIAGTGLFALWGLLLVATEIPLEKQLPLWVFNYFFLSFLLLPAIGMCAGWIMGFPRWSYPYVSHTLTFSVFVLNVSTPGPLFDQALWGWRALIPLATVIGMAFLVTRSTDPIIKFFTNIWNDWTLLAFGIFGLLPLRVVFSFDVTNRGYRFDVMVVFALLMVSTALIHMRVSRQWHRIAVLLIGSTLMTTIVEGARLLYWQGTEQMQLGQSIIRWVAIVLSMLFPFLIELWRRAALKWDGAGLSRVS